MTAASRGLGNNRGVWDGVDAEGSAAGEERFLTRVAAGDLACILRWTVSA